MEKVYTAGVSQGSMVEPALFLYYVINLGIGIALLVRLFADDTVLYSSLYRTHSQQHRDPKSKTMKYLGETVQSTL